MRAIIRTAIAPMREAPGADAPLTDEVLCGMSAEILEEAGNGWFRVRTEYRYEGYLFGGDLMMDQTMAERWLELSKRWVMQAFADVLARPAVQGQRVICLTRGAVIHVPDPVEEADGWVRITLCDGSEGYMKRPFIGPLHGQLSSFREDAFRSRVVETAKSYLGTQYRWGGKTPLGIDCSGLTFMSYQINGVTIYRDAGIKAGFPVRKIPFSRKKPGDLLYFPGHVAMYLGEGRYIHSTAKNGSDGVVINSLDESDADYRSDLPNLLYATGSIF